MFALNSYTLELKYHFDNNNTDKLIFFDGVLLLKCHEWKLSWKQPFVYANECFSITLTVYTVNAV